MFEKMGIADELGQKLNEVRRLTPLEQMFKHWDDLDKYIKNSVQKLFTEYVRTQKDLLDRAVISSPETTSLKISLVLKEDTFDNRMIFHNLAQEYDVWSFSKRYPLIFSFVSKELSTKINVIEEISL